MCFCNRGNLNLAILPTSDLRISFIGDDGNTERVGTFCSESDCSAVEIKDIVADESGRSFLLSIPAGGTFYFWCSEKSKLLGDELRRKVYVLMFTACELLNTVFVMLYLHMWMTCIIFYCGWLR